MGTRPSDCALLVCLPLSRDELFERIDNPERSDFASMLSAAHGWAGREAIWVDRYEHEACYVREVASSLARVGVETRLGATLEDFAQVLLTHGVVILVAHWRGAELQSADICSPRALLGDLLAVAGEAWARSMQPELRRLAQSSTAPDLVLSHRLAALLNRHVIYSPPINEATRDAPLEEVFWPFHAREFLDGRWPGVRRGNQIEFFDGLRSTSEVCTAVPADYRGVIDLTVCSSVPLAAAIRGERRCRVAANRAPTDLRFRMALLLEVIDILQDGDLDYMDAVNKLRIGLIRRQSSSKRLAT